MSGKAVFSFYYTLIAQLKSIISGWLKFASDGKVVQVKSKMYVNVLI